MICDRLLVGRTLTLEQRAAVVEVCMRSGPSCDMRRKSAKPE